MSSNLSFSLQWSNGDVCSLLVQLNFKKLYTHAEYHYCKHNYHKLSLPSVALLSLCMILLTYSVADINSVPMLKGRVKGSGKFMSFWNLVGHVYNHCCCVITWVWGNQKHMLAYFPRVCVCVGGCFCVYQYMRSYMDECTNWRTSHPNCSLFTLCLQAILIVECGN